MAHLGESPRLVPVYHTMYHIPWGSKQERGREGGKVGGRGKEGVRGREGGGVGEGGGGRQ